jgi:hypothetical protein
VQVELHGLTQGPTLANRPLEVDVFTGHHVQGHLDGTKPTQRLLRVLRLRDGQLRAMDLAGS